MVLRQPAAVAQGQPAQPAPEGQGFEFPAAVLAIPVGMRVKMAVMRMAVVVPGQDVIRTERLSARGAGMQVPGDLFPANMAPVDQELNIFSC